MDWKKAEEMHEFVPTGLKPPVPPNCVPSARGVDGEMGN